jgi:hypothetical protein
VVPDTTQCGAGHKQPQVISDGGQPRSSTTLVRLGLNAAVPGAPIGLLDV